MRATRFATGIETLCALIARHGLARRLAGPLLVLMQMRDADPSVLAAMESALHDLVAEANAAGPCEAMAECIFRSTPKVMNAGFQAALAEAAAHHAPGLAQSMPSGAGHDAQILAQIMPAAMLFVPSIGGISHHIAEDTARPDIVLGCQVLASGAAAILEA